MYVSAASAVVESAAPHPVLAEKVAVQEYRSISHLLDELFVEATLVVIASLVM